MEPVWQEDQSKGRYGNLPLQTTDVRPEGRLQKAQWMVPFKSGQTVWVRGRFHSFKSKDKKHASFVLRQQQWSVQVVVDQSATISRQMMKFISKITPESVVDIEATIQTSDQKIVDCSQQDVQLNLNQVWVVSASHPELPLELADACCPDGEGDGCTLQLDTKLDNRILDLRTTTNQSIFRVQGAICELFREFMGKNGFLEIHTPKIVSAVTEGFANVFEVPYFNNKAYLAQSPQLYKQMAISSDFDRVFCIGSVFRAENADTHRHLTEFVCMDFEMEFDYHYHEVVEMVGRLFVFILKSLQATYRREIAMINKQYPSEPFKFLEPSLVITFEEGMRMLNKAGAGIKEDEDLSIANEKLLGCLVKAKYDTDFFILDKFPTAARPFYTMPDFTNKKWSNSFDVYMRGEEIVSGAQRIHEPDFLIERATACGMRLDDIKGYIDSFRYGGLPHAGAGIGLERVTMLFLGIDNIRKVSMFPRDSKRMFP